MRLTPLLLACLFALPAAHAAEPPKYLSAKEILDASPDADWRTLDPANTLYMDVPGGRVVIELAPGFAPAHVANIRTLAREGFWNGLAIYRSQDNFVVQFGDADAEDTAKAKPLGTAKTKLPAEFARTGEGVSFTRLPDVDGWAPEVGFVDGFPVGRDPKTNEVWLAHCYGALGAGRGGPPDSSNGSELYVVTGQSPRQLDRNITLVGRVVKGMELLSAIPRGPEPMGFYEKAEERTPITAIRLARDGFEVSPRLAGMINGNAPQARSRWARDYFAKADGSLYQAGDLLRNPAYARTVRTLAEDGPGALYGGPLGRAVAETVAQDPRPGALTEEEPSGRITVDPDLSDSDASQREASRGNVARAIVAVLNEPGTVGRKIDFVDGDVPVAEAVRGD